MSVTFTTSDILYDATIEEFEGEPALTVYTPKPGFTEINLSNTNFRDFMLLLNRRKDALNYAGTWNREDMVDILIQLTHTENVNNFVKETTATDRFVSFGRDTEYVLHRFAEFKKLINDALERNVTIKFG